MKKQKYSGNRESSTPSKILNRSRLLAKGLLAKLGCADGTKPESLSQLRNLKSQK